MVQKKIIQIGPEKLEYIADAISKNNLELNFSSLFQSLSQNALHRYNDFVIHEICSFNKPFGAKLWIPLKNLVFGGLFYFIWERCPNDTLPPLTLTTLQC